MPIVIVVVDKIRRVCVTRRAVQLSAWVLNGRCSGDIMAAAMQRLTLSAENGGEERCSPAPKLCQLIVFIPLNLSRVLNRCSSAHGGCNLSGGYKRTSALSLKRALLVLMRPSHASTCTFKHKEPRHGCSLTLRPKGQPVSLVELSSTCSDEFPSKSLHCPWQALLKMRNSLCW